MKKLLAACLLALFSCAAPGGIWVQNVVWESPYVPAVVPYEDARERCDMVIKKLKAPKELKPRILAVCMGQMGWMLLEPYND